MSGSRDRLAGLSPEKRALLVRRLKEQRSREVDLAEAWPQLEPDPKNRHEPFALTPLQQAYWVGRDAGFDLGQVATHSYMELEGRGLDVGRLEAAWNELVRRHDMLRAFFLEDGRQQTHGEVDDYRIEVEDLTGASSDEIDASLARTRERMSHAILDASSWPLFELRATRLPENTLRLFLGVDALIVDAWSVRRIFEEWAALYESPQTELPPIDATFRDYVRGLDRVADTDGFRRAETYWQGRAGTLPPAPVLPLARAPRDLEHTTFVRRTRTLSPERWTRLQERAGTRGMTATAITLAAYADVLSLWAETPHFTVSVPQFNRHPLHADVDRIVGEFASFSLLEIDNRGDADFEARARRHQERLWEDLDHAVYGGVRVLRDIARQSPGSAAPIMPVVFTSAPQGGDGGGVGESLPERLWDVVYVNNQSSQVWLDNHLSEREGGLVCDWDTVDDLFPGELPQEMLEAFMRHLERLADDDAWWERSWVAAAADLLPPAHLAIHDAAAGAERPVPDERIQDAFYRFVSKTPDAEALVTPEDRFTYLELAGQIEHVARELRALGLGTEARVAIVMEKGWEQVAAAYACLEAGAAYVPLDAADPPGRRVRLLERASVSAILTQPWLTDIGGWPEGVEPKVVKRTAPDEAVRVRQREPGTGPGDVAFVLYTSGSTGEPKAVQIEHRGVVNALVATANEFDVSAADRVLGLTALHHDMSVFDTFGVLGAGGTLVLPDASGRRDPAHWAELMTREGATMWNSVPAMMSMLLAYAEEGRGAIPSTLRTAFLGGDWIPITLPDRLRAHVPSLEIVSVGGPTETTLWNIWHRVAEVSPDAPSIPYGKPIQNTRYHVLSAEGAPRPLFVGGLLWVSGPGVTRGYLEDPAATAAKRSDHPTSGEEMWCTGDVGRRLSDGSIEFLGRSDLQVQLRGHRIELGEIEAHVARFDGVSESVVAAVEDSRGGLQLTAYVVWASDPSPDALTEYLADRLAAHMVPAAIVALSELPLTRNGKVDRSSLPGAAEVGGLAGAGAPEPSSPESGKASGSAEATILDLIEEVLGTRVDPVGNLLEYGANSIDMVRIGNRLEDSFGRRPPIDEIFRLQTARALAGYYAESEAEETARAPQDPVAARLASYRVALSPEERQEFKAATRGLRDDLSGFERVHLSKPMDARALDQALWERRSHRRYGPEPIPTADFSGLMAGFGQRTVHGSGKRLYGSPGGLYPTQVYLHVQPGRVEGMPGGAYYYDPVEHELVRLAAGASVTGEIHVPFVNAPVYEGAAFSVFFVVQLDAIGPSYGARSLHFATLEAGVMAATIEMWATRWNIGLCQIGDVKFDQIRDLFRLDEGHVFLHSMVGGPSVGDGAESREVAPPAEGGGDDQATAARAPDRFPLSAAQRRLWQLGELAPGTAWGNLPLYFEVRGPLRLDALEQALQDVLERQAALRTRYEQDPRGVRGFVAEVPDVVLEIDPSSDPGSVRDRFETEAREPLDPGGPLFRARWSQTGEDEGVLFLLLHHLLTDGWGIGLFLRELSTCYAARVDGQSPGLSPLRGSFVDEAIAEGGSSDSSEALAYWQDRLDGAPAEVALPSRSAPDEPGYQSRRVHGRLDSRAADALRRRAAAEGVTPFAALIGALQVVLSRYTGAEDVVVGTTVSVREGAAREHLVGNFGNNVLLRTDLSGDPDLGTVLARLRETMPTDLAHQTLSLEQLMRGGNAASMPRLNVLFMLREGSPEDHLVLPGCEVVYRPIDIGVTSLDLSLDVFDQGDRGFALALEYRLQRIDEPEARALVEDYLAVLSGVAEGGSQSLSALPVRHGCWSGGDASSGTPAQAAVVGVAAPDDDVTETEAYLLGIWREALELEDVDPMDNFFELGGHSLLAITVLERIEEERGVRLTPVDLVSQTLAQLASTLEAAGSE